MTAPSALALPALGRIQVFALASACGIAVANIYYNQPMLGLIRQDFAGDATTAMIPTGTQLGYAAGLFLLVPLGDLLDRRRLIVGQFVLLALALLAAALSPSAAVLVAASLLVGASAAVAQQIVPLAASLAAPERRGGVVGSVMGGLLSGILLSRTLSGFVAAQFGWRDMFWLAVPLALATAAVLARMLPRTQRVAAGLGYGQALRSLGQLWREFPALRRATLTQAALFASFSAFWTVLALHLEEPAIHLGSDVAGLFGVLGAAGVLAAPLAGRLADRYGSTATMRAGVVVALASWPLMAAWPSVIGLGVGVLVLDLGVHASLVSNQHVIYALRPEARSRLNTVFMTGMFVGGAVGSAGAMAAWGAAGWGAVSAYGAGLALLGLLRAFSPR
jgi:predicted MFS family arabinose efflux permease